MHSPLMYVPSVVGSPTLGIRGEAARSESKQGGPEGLRAFLHDAFRGGADPTLRKVLL